MRRTILCLTMLAAAVQPAAAQLPQLHVPAPGGWEAVDQEYRYGRDALWEYINGAAELFLTYRFGELVVADFERGDAALTVSVYDMGARLDAYGVFEKERPRGAQAFPGAGAAAVLQPPYQALMIKDRYYVKIECGGGDVTDAALGAALVDVAAGLPGDDTLPAELALLPPAGRVPGSVAFTGAQFLGFEDLRQCLHADYEADGAAYRLFVLTRPEDFLAAAKRKHWTLDEAAGKMRFSREVPYRGVVVLLGDERQLVGVAGLEDVDAATRLLVALVK